MGNCIISPIFYMGNKKKLINRGLVDLFPTNINTFVDLFSGSGIVAMNTHANKYIINDYNNNLFKLYKLFKSNKPSYIINSILRNVYKFGLNRTGIKQNSEEADFYKEKYFNLRKQANHTHNIIDLYTCMFYSFSQQMRFNQKGEFNMPFGNGAFTTNNENYIINGCNFFRQPNVLIGCADYRLLPIEKLKNNDFVYLDPPYLNTTATYNENNGWTEKDEMELYQLCERLNKIGILLAKIKHYKMNFL